MSGRSRARVLAAGAVWLASLVAVPSRTIGQETPAGDVTAVDSASAAEATRAGDGSSLTDPAEAELDARAAEVAGELRCPVCRNQSVLESNAELSREMQSVVRERLAAGETPEEVKAYFVSRYGEWILLQPKARGINLLVYGLPVLALIVGFLIARNRLRKWATAGVAAAGEAEATGLSAADEEWLREALREG